MIVFAVPGEPRGYTTTNRNARPSAAYMRYKDWMDEVRAHAIVNGLKLPLYCDRENPVFVGAIPFFTNGIHCDPENVRKGACDALFYLSKEEKNNDKHTSGWFSHPQYDKENPRTIILVGMS